MSEQMNEPAVAETPNAPVVTPSKSSLDKTGKTMLAITTILSAILIIIGIFLLGGNSESSSQPPSLSLGYETSITDESYNTCEYTFTPSYSGYYYIYLDNAYLYSVKDEDGYNKNTQQESSYSSSYDYIYQVYLSSNETYTLKITPTSDDASVKVSRS